MSRLSPGRLYSPPKYKLAPKVRVKLRPEQGLTVISMLLGAAAMQALVWLDARPDRFPRLAVQPPVRFTLALGSLPTEATAGLADWPHLASPDPERAIAQAENAACPSPLLLAASAGDYWQLGKTWSNLAVGYAREAIGAMGPVLAAAAQPAPWPEIHPSAQRARVPILMYHDILPEMQVFFDVTPEQLEADFELLRENGLTPVSLDQLAVHLRTGVPLPPKPVLLTFDDGYAGHYDYVYQLLRRYRYPAAFSVFTAKPDGDVVGRSTLTWEQLRVMAADPLVTIVSHGVRHPPDLRQLTNTELRQELVESKRRLEAQLGIPIRYFTYPEGKHDERVMAATAAAGYELALAMDDTDERTAGESDSVLNLSRFGQSQLEQIIDLAWGGPPLPSWTASFDFTGAIARIEVEDDVPLTLISGGKPITIHADSRYQVQDIITGTAAVAAVDGAFFSLEYLDSNVMIGPVLSQATGKFIPGNASENPRLTGRPLVLISDTQVKFVPFAPDRHNTLAGIQTEMPEVTDAFVGAAWLVRDSVPQPDAAFGDLFDFNAARHRAFWGINRAGQPVVGVTHAPIGSVDLGAVLHRHDLRDAVMLDSGASTSLAYEGESLVGYIPRPVPHVVALVPSEAETASGGGCGRARLKEGQ